MTQTPSVLDQFRSDNPQYADVPDSDAAEALYQMHYSDIPRAQFFKTIGVMPKPLGMPLSSDEASYLAKTGKGSTMPGPSQQTTDQPKKGMPSYAPSILQGLEDPVEGTAQIGAHLLTPDMAPSVDKWIQQHESDYQNWRQNEGIGDPNGFDFGRFAGNAGATVPLGFAMPGSEAEAFLPRLASGAATGAATNAAMPVDTSQTPDFWDEKRDQALEGAAAGAAAPAVGSAAARVISPALTPQLQTLRDLGVSPTLGQRFGGTANRLEESVMGRFPIVGDFVKSGRAAAVDEFNRGLFNKALAPINQSIDPGTKLGYPVVAEANDKWQDSFNNLLPHLQVRADMPFMNDLQRFQTASQRLAPDQQRQFQNLIKNDVLGPFARGGSNTLPGTAFKDMDSTLGQEASDYMHSPNPADRAYGKLVRQVQASAHSMLERANPQAAAQLQAHDLSYAQLLRLTAAAGKPGADLGVFSPAQLAQAVRETDPSIRHNALGKCRAFVQDAAGAGKSVLSNREPNSGTPYKQAMDLGAAGGLGALALTHPAVGTAAIAGTGGLSLAYSPLARKILAALTSSRPAIAPTLAQGVRSAMPALSAAAPLALSPP